MTITRRRGTAIVETPNGILVASGKRKLFLLPGGGAKKNESRKRAAIRELEEETSLRTYSCEYLFTSNEPKYNSEGKKRKIRNLHKVFLIKATGNPKPSHHDVAYIDYWKPRSKIELSKSTKIIIEKYLKEFKE
ncbi:NUDIX domain-containing protein [Candidatus Woesearchaeota archaeon]|nr:NUDIX domain-containing protein [Candidatus Woesearchaeota archaeon]